MVLYVGIISGTDLENNIASIEDLNSMVGGIFSLLKKELDNLRRKELPNSLTQPKDSRERPFKF